jgi:orotate phosphoribosyltransferase
MAQEPDPDLTSEELHKEVLADITKALIDRQGLILGRFKLRGQRTTPYLLRLDRLTCGQDCFAIARAMAVTIRAHHGDELDLVWGTPYGGIPLAVMTANYYSLLVGRETHWGYGRKPTDPVSEDPPDPVLAPPDWTGAKAVIVDDLFVEGEGIRQQISDLKRGGADVVGAVTLIDRCERSRGKFFSDLIHRDTGVPVVGCVTLPEILTTMDPKLLPEDQREVLLQHLSPEAKAYQSGG